MTTTGLPWVNACYDLLDQAVVDGRADEPLLLGDAASHARLLEDVAAVAGVLRAQAVEPGTPVSVTAHDPRQAVVALLAAARLGGTLATGSGAGTTVDDEQVGELTWAEALRLGRTDPAPAAALADGDPWATGRTVGDLARNLVDLAIPAEPAALIAVLTGSSLEP